MGPCPPFVFLGALTGVVSVLPGDRLERIRAVADRVARSYRLDIFDVQFRREPAGWVLRIIIDRPPAGPPGDADVLEEPVSLADCELVSQDVSAILDVEDVLSDHVFGHPYTLEVSSPGLDRPLRHADDYRRFAGRLAKIVLTQAIDGQKYFAGRIRSVEEDTVVLEAGRRTCRIPLGVIARARLDVEF